MTITATDLRFYTTLNGLGGAITTTEINNGAVNNIFAKIGADQALAGETQYQCIYFKNTNTELTLKEALMWISTNTPNTTTNLFIGVGSSGVGGTEQTIANINTAPVGITFTDVIDNVIPLGDIPVNSYIPVWLQRVNDPNTQAYVGDGAQISYQGVTEASL